MADDCSQRTAAQPGHQQHDGSAGDGVPDRPVNDQPSEAKCPQRQSLWQAICRNVHGRCLCLSLLICLCIFVTFWCQLEKINQILIGLQILEKKLFQIEEENACEEGLVLLPLICMVSLYGGYLFECWHCTTRLVLMYRCQSGTVYSYVEQMRQAQPIIWWKAACFHHVRTTRPVARYRNGTTYSNSQVFQERVTTHVSGSYFSYSACGTKDISKQLTDLELYPTTRIYFSKGFAFANERSAAEFDEQRSTFFRANERYDHYLEIREGLDLVGVNFQEYMIAVGDSHHNPWYNNQLAFWLFSVALLSWPMRVLLEYNTAYVNFQMVKLFGSNYGGGESPCHISRVSTLDSLSNCMIAPSYSEAMLAERIYCLRPCSNSLDDHRPSEQPKNGRKCSGTRVSLRIGQVLPYQVGVSLEEESNVSSMRRALVDRQENLTDLLGEAQDEQESGTATKNCQLPEPPSYEEVIEDQRRVLATEMAPRLSLKTYWNHLIGLFRSNLDQTGLPRSFTDKDLFQKILAAQLKRKPCTSSSYGDISSNLIANV